MSIVFVSNRLPMVFEQGESGWNARPASGGLVTALVPVLKKWRGMWIGWPGVVEQEVPGLAGMVKEFSEREGFGVEMVPLTQEDYKRFYEGFCNEIIWPLFHDLQSFCNFRPESWTSSLKVEQTFADVVQRSAKPEDLIWVQDYHLMGLGKVLFERGMVNKRVFFLHIPFPAPDIFCKLPWRKEVLKALLHYEVIGLQTRRDLENFCDCVKRILPGVLQRQSTRQGRMELDGRASVVGVFPIGIDFAEFAQEAASPAIVKRVKDLRENYPGRQIILGVDRLDYTKGVPYRLRAFERALERFPDLHKNVTYMQVVIPSRETVVEYQSLKGEIERLVAQINGKFTQPGWVPIHHMFRHWSREELVAWYRFADMALVTSLKDGMNLVAKEYCACQVDGNGVLVLSEFAGVAEQLGKWAVVVNPYDIECVADAIKLAAVMTPAERKPAMERLRTNVREQDVFWWLTQFLRVCGVRLEERAGEMVVGKS